MKTNKDLTINEFLCALNIKRAMAFAHEPADIDMMKKYLKIALGELYGSS